MISLIDIFYFFIYGALLLLSMVGLWFTTVMPAIDRWSRRFFRLYYMALIMCLIFGILEGVLQYCHAPVSAIWFVLFMESLLPSLTLLMLTIYLLRCSGENMRRSRLLGSVLVLWGIYMAMVVASPFIGAFTYVAPDGQYYRKAAYPLLILPLIVIMLLNLAGAIKYRKRLSGKTYLGFLVAIVPLTIALAVLLFADAFLLLDSCIILAALSMYGLIMSDQIEKEIRWQKENARQQAEIARQQTEIANQRTSIMVLQMRPHFIYNTMTSIYCLCNQDPETARQVIMDFTTYLRKNFTAIASASPIPFSSELEHTRAYVAVEQALYKDCIFIEYDTPHTFFRVPPLTLQPIVENAVKHGRDPYAGPFHISVRTRKTDLGSEIVVADNGRGFVPPDESEPHTALKNIRQRLEFMCGGTMDISPGDDGGTVVKITIPDDSKEFRYEE